MACWPAKLQYGAAPPSAAGAWLGPAPRAQAWRAPRAPKGTAPGLRKRPALITALLAAQAGTRLGAPYSCGCTALLELQGWRGAGCRPKLSRRGTEARASPPRHQYFTSAF